MQDTFEDAIDTGSVRSLTKRSSSFHRPRSPSMDDSAAADADHDARSHTTETPQVPKTTDIKEEEQEDVFKAPAQEQENKSLHRISHASKVSEASAFSAASLDDVSLNDNSTIGDKTGTLEGVRTAKQNPPDCTDKRIQKNPLIRRLRQPRSCQ